MTRARAVRGPRSKSSHPAARSNEPRGARPSAVSPRAAALDRQPPRPLARAFYARPTVEVARALLGCRLVRSLAGGRRGPGGVRLVGRIVEAEAYVGEEDRACHAAAGRTARNAVMYGPPGFAYVYLIYGMHWMLNVVTETEGTPAAVLIRALEPLQGFGQMARHRRLKGLKGLKGLDGPTNAVPLRARAALTGGPGRLCQALAIDRRQNGADLCGSGRLWIEPGPAPPRIAATPRIGVDYAGAWSRKRWRFVDADSPFLSVRPRR